MARIGKFMEAESQLVVGKGSGKGKGESFNGYGIAYWNILGLNKGDGPTTFWMY